MFWNPFSVFTLETFPNLFYLIVFTFVILYFFLITVLDNTFKFPCLQKFYISGTLNFVIKRICYISSNWNKITEKENPNKCNRRKNSLNFFFLIIQFVLKNLISWWQYVFKQGCLNKRCNLNDDWETCTPSFSKIVCARPAWQQTIYVQV